ncbi:MAG TPA: type III pantothenate kinase, partial [Pyrinomonadaceae bacterium]|nr:type III pantothenate kinase [Pyrinomonadaceae bacterium]
MLLVIDAGNTNVTLGVFRGSDLLAQWRLTTDHDRSSDEYGVQVQELFERTGIDLKEIDAVVIASVVPPVNPSLS